MRFKLPAGNAGVPDVTGGKSAPTKLTEWKIRAIKIAVILDKRGRVSRNDFKVIGIDMRRWRDQGWILASENGFVAGSFPAELKRQHPVNYEQIAADFDKWAPPESMLGEQKNLL